MPFIPQHSHFETNNAKSISILVISMSINKLTEAQGVI